MRAAASKASDGAEVSEALAKRLALAKLALGADEADLAVCNAPLSNVCSAYVTLGANIPLMLFPKTSHLPCRALTSPAFSACGSTSPFCTRCVPAATS